MKGIYKKINYYLEKIILAMGGVALALFLIIVFSQIILRNIFKMPLIWANDVSLILFIWSVFLGASCAVKYKTHYVVDVFPQRFVKANAFLDIIADIAGFIFFYVLIRHGALYTILSASRISTSLSISQAYFLMVIPLSGIAMTIFNIGNIAIDIERFILLIKEKSSEEERYIK